MIATLIGWPAIIGSFLFSAIGIKTNRPYLLAVGAVLISGFAWYLFGSPALIFEMIGLLLPTLHLVAMYLVTKGKKLAAACCLVPQLLVMIYFAAVVALLEG